MKTKTHTKVTYTTGRLIFNTIVPMTNLMEVGSYMAYNYDNVDVIKMRPSVKTGYSHCLNHLVK